MSPFPVSEAILSLLHSLCRDGTPSSTHQYKLPITFLLTRLLEALYEDLRPFFLRNVKCALFIGFSCTVWIKMRSLAQFGPVHWNGTLALLYSDCWSSRLAAHWDLHCWDCKHASCAAASVPVYSDLAVASMPVYSDFPSLRILPWPHCLSDSNVVARQASLYSPPPPPPTQDFFFTLDVIYLGYN